MNVIQTLKKLLTPLGSDIYPGDLFFAPTKVGYVMRKIKTGAKYYFQIRWTGIGEHLIEEYSGLEIKEKIAAGDWQYSPIIIKKSLINKIR